MASMVKRSWSSTVPACRSALRSRVERGDSCLSGTKRSARTQRVGVGGPGQRRRTVVFAGGEGDVTTGTTLLHVRFDDASTAATMRVCCRATIIAVTTDSSTGSARRRAASTSDLLGELLVADCSSNRSLTPGRHHGRLTRGRRSSPFRTRSLLVVRGRASSRPTSGRRISTVVAFAVTVGHVLTAKTGGVIIGVGVDAVGC